MRELTLRGLIILFAATLAGCPPGNQAPSAPMISGIQSTNTSISGTIGACVDDGLPASPGICSLTVLVADPGTTGPARGSGAVLLPQSGGSFSVTGLTMGQDYSIVATADDGELTSQSGATASTNSAPSTGMSRPLLIFSERRLRFES